MYNITAHNGTSLRVSAPNILVAIEQFISLTELNVYDIKSVIFSV